MRSKKSAIAQCFWHLFCLVSAAQSVAGAPVPEASSYPPDAPAVVAVLPDDYTSYIDEEQIFLLRLSAPATTTSIEANAYCDVENTGGHIPITVLVDQDRQAMLDQFQLHGDSIVVLRCRDTLPSSASMTLHWGAGIANQAGVTLKSEQAMHFTVRGPFRVIVGCTPAFPAGGCSPEGPIKVSFTAALDRAQAASVRLIGGDGTTFEPRKSLVPMETMREISFDPPFPPASTLTVMVPDDLRDEAGRTTKGACRVPASYRAPPIRTSSPGS
jgi:alpha-2-macroglobulin